MAHARSIQNGVLGVAILGELILLIGHPLFGWGPDRRHYAPTPPTLTFTPPGPPGAYDTLLGLARAAARTPPTAGRGRYAYVSRLVWSLADQTTRNAHPKRPLIRTVQSWRAADGRGRRITVRRTGTGEQTIVTTLPPGRRLPALGGGEAALGRRLGLGYPTRSPPAAEFDVVTDLFATEPVGPLPRAEILRLLARIPGIALSGVTADRLGHRGVAVSLASDLTGQEIRYTLVFDPRTGTLLESDQALVGDPTPAHSLNVTGGSLLAYTVYGRAGRVPRIGARP